MPYASSVKGLHFHGIPQKVKPIRCSPSPDWSDYRRCGVILHLTVTALNVHVPGWADDHAVRCLLQSSADDADANSFLLSLTSVVDG